MYYLTYSNIQQCKLFVESVQKYAYYSHLCLHTYVFLINAQVPIKHDCLFHFDEQALREYARTQGKYVHIWLACITIKCTINIQNSKYQTRLVFKAPTFV